MASKKASDDSARMKALQMREAQAKAERKTKIIVISVVVVAVLAIVTAVAIAISHQIAQKQATITGDPSELFPDYAAGKPIAYSHLGVGKLDESLPTITEYFDYSCHACADLDVIVGADLTAAVDNGEFNILYQPVKLVEMAYMDPATAASLIVAQKDPEHWAAFHHEVLQYFHERYKKGDGTVVTNAEKSRDQLQVLAASAGVPAEVSNLFPISGAAEYLEAATTTWREAEVEGREQMSTPEFVNDKSQKVFLYGIEAPDLMQSVRSGLGLTQ